jgi:hypothetical protein
MNKIIIVFTFFATCLFSKCTCSTESAGNGDVLTIKFDFDENPVKLSDVGLIYDIEILNLDCKEAIFGFANKIIRYKNRIFLLDMGQTNSVVIYDTLGNFVNQIDKRGQGPNDYIQLFDIFINHEDETLNLVSFADYKILKHDLDGNIIRVEKMPKMFFRIVKTKDGYIGDVNNLSQDKPYKLWTFSNEMELQEGFFELDPSWDSKAMAGQIFSTYKDRIYYTTPMDFNIYALKDGKFSIAYTFDFGKWALPETYREYDKYERLLETGDGEKVYILDINKFQETQNYLIAKVVHQSKPRMCIYNKQTKKTYLASLWAPKDKYAFDFGNIIGMDETAIYALIEPSDLKQFRDDFESQYPEQTKRLREKFSYIDEEGNPFLVIYSIK